MLKRLHENKGLKTCVWINPYIGQRSKLFDEGVANDYFILNKDGSVFQCDMWQPGMAIVDFTNPEACEWYQSKLRALCEMGVDCFKTDFGERIPTDVVYYNGADPIKMHNYYTYLYNKTVFDVLKEYYGENKACLFARSATTGGQQFPVHWGGDCSAEYSSMAETIRGGLSLQSPASASSRMISLDLKLQLHRISIRDGAPSVFCPPIQDCTATPPTAFRGCSTRKPATFCASSPS